MPGRVPEGEKQVGGGVTQHPPTLTPASVGGVHSSGLTYSYNTMLYLFKKMLLAFKTKWLLMVLCFK